jgi:hypothetical protein
MFWLRALVHRDTPPLQFALQLIGNVIAVSISSLVYHANKLGVRE